MSANNQLLIKEYRGKYCVFEVMAESWDEKNEVDIKDAIATYPTQIEAVRGAKFLDNTEYGVLYDCLAKDSSSVVVVDNKR